MSGIFIEFPHTWMAFVDGGVLSKFTMRLAHISILQADPQATRGGHSGWIEEGRSGDVKAKAAARVWKAVARMWKIVVRM